MCDGLSGLNSINDTAVAAAKVDCIIVVRYMFYSALCSACVQSSVHYTHVDDDDDDDRRVEDDGFACLSLDFQTTLHTSTLQHFYARNGEKTRT